PWDPQLCWCDLAQLHLLEHFRPAEIDHPATAQRRSIADQHDLLIIAQSLHDLLGLDEPARDLLAAAGLVAGMRIVAPPRRTGAFAERIAERGELAADPGQHLGGFEVLNRREALEKCGIEPGPLPALAKPRA